MRPHLNPHYLTVLLVTALLVLPAWCTRAAEGDAVTLNVQGVLATRGENKVTPTVAPSLKAYAGVLKRFPYDKYEDIGSGSGAVTAGQATSIKVGSHTIDATLVANEKGTAKIKYTIKDSNGQPLGSDTMALTAGQILPIQIGEPAFPIILLFQSTR